MLEFLRWLVGATLLALGGCISLVAVTRTVVNCRNRRQGVDRWISGVPFVGPILFGLGWAVSPLPWSWWALLVLVVDFDTPLALAYVPILILRSLLRSGN